MVAMLLAGYLAPAVVDWAQVRCWSSATAWGLLWLLVILLLLLSAPKPVLELIGSGRRGQAGHSDADQLARLTPGCPLSSGRCSSWW